MGGRCISESFGSGPENTIPGIAKAGADIAILVQPIIHRRRPDRYIRMGLPDVLNTLGCCQQADEADALGAANLQPIQRGHR